MVQGGDVMNLPKRVSFNLLDEELQQLINTKTKIFPVQSSYLIGGNINNYEYVRVVDTERKNEVYFWDGEKFVLIGADDYEVSWEDVKGKPPEYSPEAHDHREIDIVDLDKYTKEEINEKLLTKAESDHDHNEMYVKPVSGKSLTSNDFTDDLKIKLVNLSNEAAISHDQIREELDQHLNGGGMHVTIIDKEKWDTVTDKVSTGTFNQEITRKVNTSTFNGHTTNATVHVTQEDKDRWNTGSDKELHFTKIGESDTWHINHGLNKFPTINILDHEGALVVGEVEYVDKNYIILRFSTPVKGDAYLS